VTASGRWAERIARAQAALREEGLGGMVLGPSDQMRYLTGWAEHGHERFIGLFVPEKGEPVFLVPEMNAPQARRSPAGLSAVVGWRDAEGWQSAAGEILSRWRVEGRTLAVDGELHAVHLLDLQAVTPASRWVAAGALMARLREIKSAEELELLRRSASVTDAVYEACLPHLREGITERQVQDVISRLYAERGTRPAFALVCFGANSALPHHSTGDARLRRGDVVILDIGCLLEGYASDITRTLAVAEPEPEADRVYDVVWRAHCAALQTARPGVTCEAVDEAARAVIREAGYGGQFIHRTGHGIGLSTHEPPYIVQGNRQELRPGMCFSDEPGVYLEGRFGVRIENIVAVTETGAEPMNAWPPDRLIRIPA